MLKHKNTYEIMAPEDIGLERSNEAGIVLGKLRYAYYENLTLYGAYMLHMSLPWKYEMLYA